MLLVGLHIAHKTQNFPQWVWATFEHIHNAPECEYNDDIIPRCVVKFPKEVKQYSFAKNGCSLEDCPMNVKPESAGTAWENYMLVNTQWPTAVELPAGRPEPDSLANAVMETYFQGTTPQSQTSSCMGCHYLATGVLEKPEPKADFTFLLNSATTAK